MDFFSDEAKGSSAGQQAAELRWCSLTQGEKIERLFREIQALQDTIRIQNIEIGHAWALARQHQRMVTELMSRATTADLPPRVCPKENSGAYTLEVGILAQESLLKLY